jgi:hypothetical protein
MTFTRDPVRMSGTLRGNNQKADCTVSAVRVALSGTSLYKDCQYVVEWVSKTLPLGTYRLSVEGKIIDVLYSQNGWHAIQLPSSIKPGVRI